MNAMTQVETTNYSGHKHTVTIEPGSFIVIATTDNRSNYTRDPIKGGYLRTEETFEVLKTFAIGDIATVGSYNLVYTGIVRKITAKTVTVVEYEGHHGMERTYRFSIEKFVGKNWDFDAAEASERNANWRD
jgi:hypothetical protein